jgi:hypothetical protein
VGLIAANQLTPVARQNVTWLLDRQTLADVSRLRRRVTTATAIVRVNRASNPATARIAGVIVPATGSCITSSVSRTPR